MNTRQLIGAAVCFMAACATVSSEAKTTSYNATGDWYATQNWSDGLPGTADEAVVPSAARVSVDGQTPAVSNLTLKGQASVKDGGLTVGDTLRFGIAANQSPAFSATNSAIRVGTFSQTSAGNGVYSYRQVGGSFDCTSLMDFYGNNASTTLFENVTANFTGWRWSLFRADAPSLWRFTDSTVANAASSGFLMGVWGNSTGDLVFDRSTLDLSGSSFVVGYGNESADRPATLRFENGSTVVKNSEVIVGIVRRLNDQDAFHGGWGRIVGVDSTWTNTALTRLYLGRNDSNDPESRRDGIVPKGELILSNCTYWAETENVANVGNSALCVGHAANSTGIVQIVGGKFSSHYLYCGCASNSYGQVEIAGNPEMKVPELWIGYAVGGIGKLILHDKVQSNFTPSVPGCGIKSLSGSHRTIEYVNSAISKTSGGNQNFNSIPGTDGGSEIFRLVDGAFTNTSGIVMFGGTSEAKTPSRNFSGLEVVRSKFRSTTEVIVGRHVGMPGCLMFKDCDDVTIPTLSIGYLAGAIGKFVNEGSKLSFPEIRVCGKENGATCYYRDGAGAETTISGSNKDFRIGDKTGVFDVELGGKLIDCNRFFVGMQGTVTGEVRVVEGGDVPANQFYLGWNGKDDVARLCLNGGTLTVPWIQPYSGDYVNKCRIYFDGGTLRAKQNEGNFIHNTYERTSVGKGGAVFDSNGFSVTTAIPLAHDDREGAPAVDGGIVKKGAGTVKLTGELTFTGGLRVEAGTLDLSAAAYSATPSISGSGAGTLKAPTGGLTVTGASKVAASDTGVAVDGSVTFGPEATVTCDDPDSLRLNTHYTLLTATSVTGLPKVDLPKKRGVVYDLVNTGTAIVLTVSKPGFIITVQ